MVSVCNGSGSVLVISCTNNLRFMCSYCSLNGTIFFVEFSPKALSDAILYTIRGCWTTLPLLLLPAMAAILGIDRAALLYAPTTLRQYLQASGHERCDPGLEREHIDNACKERLFLRKGAAE